MKTVCVSACLCGEKCRWHGKIVRSKSAERILESLNADRVIKVCPEMLGGLPCPRPPVKRRKGRVFETCEDKAKRPEVTGRERTSEFLAGAEAVLRICKQEKVKTVVFAKFSPSCDIKGLTGKLLTENGIEVINTF